MTDSFFHIYIKIYKTEKVNYFPLSADGSLARDKVLNL